MTEHIITRLREKAIGADIGSRQIFTMAANLMEQQKKEIDVLLQDMSWKQKAISHLVEENEIIKKERDTLLKQLEIADCYCQFCKGTDPNSPCAEANLDCDICNSGCRCKDCRENDKWEWKGVDE